MESVLGGRSAKWHCFPNPQSRPHLPARDASMQPLIQPADTPPRGWIERLVRNPAVRSGYLSLAAHLFLALLAAVMARKTEQPQRPRPLEWAFARADDRADGDLLESVEVGGAVAEDAQPRDVPPAPGTNQAMVPLVPVPDLVAVEPPAGPPATVQPVAGGDDGGTAASTPAAGPLAQTVSTRRSGAGPPAGGGRATARGAISGGAPQGEPFAPRHGTARAAAVRGRGGTAASEAAVERGLEWLALHQAADGSWRFDLSGCQCQGACRDPGTLTSSTASTAIALLPFLGAGHTHLAGRHQETVSRGLYYLLSCGQRTARGTDFSDGNLYGHGVSTLVLAESFGMTKDESLVRPIRDAVRYTENAQDLHGGGWRYLPGQPGDITVTAWQLAALKSAQLAGLEAPSPTIDGVRRFLDRVQTQSGAAYGYLAPAAKPCTSAIGLLCRMYTGWGPEQEPLSRGLTVLAKPGPDPEAVYQNFYLAQALLQFDHPVWPRWNAKNRDQLVARQARVGHEAGSWVFADRDTAPGGRLAFTSLAILTLEVYYRLLPIYHQDAVESGF